MLFKTLVPSTQSYRYADSQYNFPLILSNLLARDHFLSCNGYSHFQAIPEICMAKYSDLHICISYSNQINLSGGKIHREIGSEEQKQFQVACLNQLQS